MVPLNHPQLVKFVVVKMLYLSFSELLCSTTAPPADEDHVTLSKAQEQCVLLAYNVYFLHSGREVDAPDWC